MCVVVHHQHAVSFHTDQQQSSGVMSAQFFLPFLPSRLFKAESLLSSIIQISSVRLIDVTANNHIRSPERAQRSSQPRYPAASQSCSLIPAAHLSVEPCGRDCDVFFFLLWIFSLSFCRRESGTADGKDFYEVNLCKQAEKSSFY